MRHVTILLAALVLVLGIHAATRADGPAGVPRWEYKRIQLYEAEYYVDVPVRRAQHEDLKKEAVAEGFDLTDRKDASKALAAAGRDGWELVQQLGLPGDDVFVLKRPFK